MKIVGSYPNTRLRRNRKKVWSRRLVKENPLSSNDLIWPIFICEGRKRVSCGKRNIISAMGNRDKFWKTCWKNGY